MKCAIILMINAMLVFITLYALLWLQNIDLTACYTMITVFVGLFSVMVLDMCN